MGIRLFITITPDEARRLYALAEHERRTPRDQASWLLGEALKKQQIQDSSHTVVLESETRGAVACVG